MIFFLQKDGTLVDNLNSERLLVPCTMNHMKRKHTPIMLSIQMLAQTIFKDPPDFKHLKWTVNSTRAWPLNKT